MKIKIIKNTISKKEIADMAKKQFGDLIKVVVDIEQEIIAIGAELHADGEVILMEKEGSKREHTWGINLYPAIKDEEWIEFDSLINLKPSCGNRSRGVENPQIQKKIKDIIKKLVSSPLDSVNH
ncbi:MAG: DUF5674 family protein [Patescibacteria group bacterium]